MFEFYGNKVAQIIMTVNYKFEDFEIFTSPAFVAKLKGAEKNEAQTILNGKIDSTAFRNRTISFLEFKKALDYKELDEANSWNSDVGKQVVQDYYKSTENTDIKKLLK